MEFVKTLLAVSTGTALGVTMVTGLIIAGSYQATKEMLSRGYTCQQIEEQNRQPTNSLFSDAFFAAARPGIWLVCYGRD